MYDILDTEKKNNTRLIISTYHAKIKCSLLLRVGCLPILPQQPEQPFQENLNEQQHFIQLPKEGDKVIDIPLNFNYLSSIRQQVILIA